MEQLVSSFNFFSFIKNRNSFKVKSLFQVNASYQNFIPISFSLKPSDSIKEILVLTRVSMHFHTLSSPSHSFSFPSFFLFLPVLRLEPPITLRRAGDSVRSHCLLSVMSSALVTVKHSVD